MLIQVDYTKRFWKCEVKLVYMKFDEQFGDSHHRNTNENLYT